MMNSGTFAILALTSAILGAVGCGSISADPIEKPSPSELESLSVESNDPYACEVVQTGDGFATRWQEEYSPLCKLTGTTCQYRDGGSYQADTATGRVTGHIDLQMWCEHPCQTDSDCPAPESGTGIATCFVHPNEESENPVGTCIVRCEGGETCQDGFGCIDEPPASGWPRICIGDSYGFDYEFDYDYGASSPN